MVTFCMRCGVSLPPFADSLIKDGKELPSPHFICPSCGESSGTKATDDNGIGKKDIVIKNGEIKEKD